MQGVMSIWFVQTVLPSSATADASGQYLFTGLDPTGICVISVDESTLPDGLIGTVAPDDDIDGESAVNLAQSDGGNLDQDFGYEEGPTGSIGDTIFLDSNGNGWKPWNGRRY